MVIYLHPIYTKFLGQGHSYGRKNCDIVGWRWKSEFVCVYVCIFIYQQNSQIQ